MKASLTFTKGFEFKASIRDHHLIMDTQAAAGGQNQGPSPKELLLASIAGCTGMDMAALCRKYKIQVDSFDLEIEAETTEKHPKVFREINLIFDFKISNVSDDQIDKLRQSAYLSMTKLCGVSAMVNSVSPIYYTLRINGEIEDRNQAKFEIIRG